MHYVIYGALSDMGYGALCDMVHFMIYCALDVEFFSLLGQD